MPPRRRYQKKKQAKSTRARKQMKRTSPALYKAVKAVAKNEALKLQETKYVTRDFGATKVYNAFDSKFGPTTSTSLIYLQPGIPPMTQGFNSNKLQGSKATIQNCFTTFSVNLLSTTPTSVDVFVRFYLLESKNVKNYSIAVPPGGLPAQNLLRIGNGEEADWFVSAGNDPRMNSMRPINKLAWTGSMKTFRLAKNPGGINGDTTSIPNSGANLSANTNAYHFTHNWGRKGKVLTYDDGDESNYPENFLPIWACVAWTVDGANTGAAYSTMPVEVVAVNHLYYKDA